eukprot:681759-Pelagomonas_calceolata.AAC.1
MIMGGSLTEVKKRGGSWVAPSSTDCKRNNGIFFIRSALSSRVRQRQERTKGVVWTKRVVWTWTKRCILCNAALRGRSAEPGTVETGKGTEDSNGQRH